MSKRLNNLSKKNNSLLKGVSVNNTIKSKYDENFRVSFEYLDLTQGQTFAEWEKENILARMNMRLYEACKQPIYKQENSKFKEYGEFPNNSGFKYPKHVEPDVNWCSMHITGKQVLGGFIVENTFYVVFLDKEHKFWISEKKHT